MEPGNNLANLEALLNILANGNEILGVAAGGPLLFMTWLPAACGLKGYWWKFLACSIALVLVGLASPGIVNLAVSSHSAVGIIVATIICILLILLQVGLALLAAFAPIVIAFREKLEKKALIIGLNLASFILPLCWIGAVIACGMKLKSKPEPFISPNN
jgi:hypothetical protein